MKLFELKRNIIVRVGDEGEQMEFLGVDGKFGRWLCGDVITICYSSNQEVGEDKDGYFIK